MYFLSKGIQVSPILPKLHHEWVTYRAFKCYHSSQEKITIILYSENQLSKGNYNDNLQEVNINGEKQNVCIRYAACKGVLECSVDSCNFAGSKAAKKCPNHPTTEMIPSGSCPVYVIYVYPQNHIENGECWITGITKDNVFNSTRNNLHNHPLSKPSKVPDIIHESVKQAVWCIPSITPGQLSLGNNTALILIIIL